MYRKSACWMAKLLFFELLRLVIYELFDHQKFLWLFDPVLVVVLEGRFSTRTDNAAPSEYAFRLVPAVALFSPNVRNPVIYITRVVARWTRWTRWNRSENWTWHRMLN